MDIEFDPAKDTVNREKHGLPLAFGLRVMEGRVAELIDPRHTAETRWLTFGLVAGRLFVCVHTQRGDRARIISVRKANRKEQQRWLEP